MERIIAHLDMDAFFAAVEERDQPWLSGKPIVIGADPNEGRGRGVVSTANYKAREYGIHSAMPISTAWRLSEEAKKAAKPPAVFLPGNHDKYSEVSERIMEILRKYLSAGEAGSPIIEVASIDEAYFELGENAKDTALKIKKEIKEKEKLTCSIGIGPNKLIAKIASDFKKPDGLTIVPEKEAEAFLEPMSVRKIPGIGPKTEEMLNTKGIKLIKDLKKYPREKLENMLGKWGAGLYDRIRGIDDSPLETNWTAKSIGEQETFNEDTLDLNFLGERLETICRSVFERFSESGFDFFRTVVLTVRFADFETKTKSFTLKMPASDLKTLSFRLTQLFLPFLDSRQNPAKKRVRLLGARVEKLTCK